MIDEPRFGHEEVVEVGGEEGTAGRPGGLWETSHIDVTNAEVLNGLDATGGNFSCIVSRSQLYVVQSQLYMVLGYTQISAMPESQLYKDLDQLSMEIMVSNVYIYSVYYTIV